MRINFTIICNANIVPAVHSITYTSRNVDSCTGTIRASFVATNCCNASSIGATLILLLSCCSQCPKYHSDGVLLTSTQARFKKPTHHVEASVGVCVTLRVFIPTYLCLCTYMPVYAGFSHSQRQYTERILLSHPPSALRDCKWKRKTDMTDPNSLMFSSIM